MAVAAASDLNSVESSYSVGTSGVHSWEQSVDPYDPTGHGSRPVRSKKDLKPHEYDVSHSSSSIVLRRTQPDRAMKPKPSEKL
ncbi:hypothetical protein EMCRGX_G016922 [Ephydatia muelleri]